ncbi:MAG TPA: response regulator transcription factor [Polyangiaceae bacterium]|nr:response regulator transcription factor [Polyangiaceae bacterium]
MSRSIPERVRIALVDDHPFVREGVRAVLESSPELEIVGEASNAQEALELAERASPAIMLVDIGLGDRNGISLTEELTLRHPQLRVIMLSMYERATYVDSARRAGARGYVVKSSAPAVLLAAIQSVSAGLEVGIGPALSSSPREILTERELEVARLCARDLSDKEIAAKLDIAVRTVESHRQNIARKLRQLQPPVSATPLGLARWLQYWGLLEDGP